MPDGSARHPRPRAGREAARPGARRRGGRRRDHGGPGLNPSPSSIPSHAARLAPLRPETVWTLDGGNLVETTGKRIRRRPLATLREVRFAAATAGRRAAVLRFARGRALIVSHGWAGPGRFEDRTDSYAAFLRAVAETAAEVAPSARFTTGGLAPRDAVIWMVALLGLGVGALMLFSLTAGAAGLGAALAARLLFVPILVFAVTPWLAPPAPRLDPRALPAGLLD